jgi:hypothetical protein
MVPSDWWFIALMRVASSLGGRRSPTSSRGRMNIVAELFLICIGRTTCIITFFLGFVHYRRLYLVHSPMMEVSSE